MTAAVALVVGLASGCSTAVSGTPGMAPVPNAKVDVVGDSGDAFDTEAKNAISDVEAFWREQYPKIAHGAALPALKGKLYSVDGLQALEQHQVPNAVSANACLKKDPSFIVDNAAYCELDDSVLWDRSPKHIIPLLAQHYGSAITALVFAHEFGHAIQKRIKIPSDTPTIDAESQADCASGAFIAAAMKGEAPHFHLSSADVDRALDGFLQIRDSTPESPQDISHGNGFDRLNSLQQGITRGVTYCFGDTYFRDRQFTERGYTDTDLYTGGNETLNQELSKQGGLFDDLNRFWTSSGTLINKKFTAVKYAEAATPKCGSASSSSEFGYCPDTNTVYYSSSFARRAYYSLTAIQANPRNGDIVLAQNQPADFALGMMFAIGWGLAARHQFFNRSVDDQAGLLAGICYAGAYGKDINLPQTTTDHPFVLSPPDLDEASSAVLNLVPLDTAFGARGTTGLERVTSFVNGYHGGLSAC